MLEFGALSRILCEYLMKMACVKQLEGRNDRYHNDIRQRRGTRGGERYAGGAPLKYTVQAQVPTEYLGVRSGHG